MEILVIFIIGFTASFFGSFTSSGSSMLAFTFLGLYGISPFAALGIFKVGTFGMQLGGLYNFARADKIIWKRVVTLTLIGIVGAYIGANIVISLDEAVLSKIIGFVLLLCVPLALFKPSLGVLSVQTSLKKEYMGHIMYFLTSIWGYSIVVGAGIVNMYSQAYFYGMSILEIKGTSKIPALIKGLVAITVFVQAGIVNWELGGVFFLGGFAGSFLGTHYSIKIGDTWLRHVLFLSVLVVSIKLILGW